MSILFRINDSLDVTVQVSNTISKITKRVEEEKICAILNAII